jgi:hypothetical protein
MSEEKAEYNLEKARRDNAILKKYAAIQKASEDKIGCQKVYVDITDDIKAALVLDEIIFFTLPRPNTGKSALRIFKNGYLWMAVRRSEWWDRKRLKEREADLAIDKLEKLNLIIKSVHRFNSLPTIHLRLNVDVFFKLYFEALERENPPEDEKDTSVSDINDLYEMMGIPFSPNGKLPNGEGRLPNGDDSSPNGDFINSPYISPTQPPRDDSKPAKAEPDKIAEWLKMGQFAGAKRETRIDAILSYLGETFHVNTETKKWKDFAKFAETRQTHHGEKIDVFVSWLLGQKDFNLQYWPPSKMEEFWPMAFVKNNGLSQPVTVDEDGFPESY